VKSFLTRKTLYATVAVTMDIFFLYTSICVASPTTRKKYNQNVDFAPPPWKNFCGRPCSKTHITGANVWPQFSMLIIDIYSKFGVKFVLGLHANPLNDWRNIRHRHYHFFQPKVAFFHVVIMHVRTENQSHMDMVCHCNL